MVILLVLLEFNFWLLPLFLVRCIVPQVCGSKFLTIHFSFRMVDTAELQWKPNEQQAEIKVLQEAADKSKQEYKAWLKEEAKLLKYQNLYKEAFSPNAHHLPYLHSPHHLLILLQILPRMKNRSLPMRKKWIKRYGTKSLMNLVIPLVQRFLRPLQTAYISGSTQNIQDMVFRTL